MSSNLAGCASDFNAIADKSENPGGRSSAECRRNALAERSDDLFEGLAIYDGREHLGDVVDLGCRVSAQLANGVVLGFFPNREAARNAILAARAR